MWSWRNPPKLDTSAGERKASWLELFYDLVYIATVIQLGEFLHHHLTWVGALQFAFLFLIVWWSWSGTTYYTNRFATDDALHRLLIFLQLFGVAYLAVNISTAFGEGGAAFALSYVGIRVVLVLMYVRAYRHAAETRPLIRNYVTGFSLGIAFWLISVFVPAPWHYLFWGLGIASEVIVHFVAGTQELEARVPFNLPHLSERYALFIIIVLGDSFIKAIGRVSDEGITTATNVFGPLAVLMVVSVWWVYFDDVAEAALRGSNVITAWVYNHLFLSASIVAFGVAVEEMTQLELGTPIGAPILWLICLSVGGYFGAVAWVDYLTKAREKRVDLPRVTVRAVAAGIIVLLPLFAAELDALPVISTVAALCAAQIAFDLSRPRSVAEVSAL